MSTPSSPQAPGGPNPPSQRVKEVANYEILGKLGQGGMGAVYKARQKSLDRIVALKILPPSIAKDTTFCERFQREARASAKLNHPHVVQGIDVGKDPVSGLWYFAMEYVDGPTLKKVLEEQKVIPEERALAIIRQVAQALEAVAAHDMVHRDIKPDNILLTQRGEAKLADLGLAKQMHEDASLTQSGQAVGTPYYMAPEQVRGAATEIDIRTDIYALGGTLYHLVVGHPPYQGQTGAVIMSMHLTEPVPSARKANPAVSEACSRLIEKMMQKKREARIQTPAELIKQIDKAINKEVTEGPHVPIRHTTGPRQPVGERRHEAEETQGGKNTLLYVGGAAAALIVLALAFKGGGKPEKVAQNDTKKPPAQPVAERPAEMKGPPAGATQQPIAPVAKTPPKPAVDPAELFKAAQEFEQKNADAFDDITQRYRRAAQAAKGTPAEAEIQDKVEDALAALQTRQSAAAETAFKNIEEKAQAAAAEGNYDAALALLQNLPPRFAEVLKERAGEKSKALHQDAEGKISVIVKKVEEFSANIEPGQGLKALEEAEKITYAPTANIVASLKKKLNDELANEGELKKKKEAIAAVKQLAQSLQNFDKAVLETKDLKAALQIAQEAAKDPAITRNEQVDAVAKAMVEVAGAFDDKEKFEQAGLSELKGKNVELELSSGKVVKGKIAKVQDGVISLEIAMAGVVAVQPVKIADLTEAQRKKTLPSYSPQSDPQRVALAYMRIQNKDAQGALENLVLCENYPLAAHCRQHVQRLQQEKEAALAEAAAPAAWGEIQLRSTPQKLTDADAKLLQEKIVKFETAFGKTQFAATIKDKLAAVKQKVNAAAAGTNLLKNGDFEQGTESWQVGEGAKIDAMDERPHGGNTALQFTILPDSRGILSQELTLEPGVQYKFSAWMRIIKSGDAGRAVLTYQEGRGRGDTTQQSLVARSDWARTEMVFTPQRGNVQVEVYIRNRGATPIVVAFDDLEVIKASSAASLAQSQLPPVNVPDAFKQMGMVFWASPTVCPQGTTREFTTNTVPNEHGKVSVVQELAGKHMSFASSYLNYPASPAVKNISATGSAFVWVRIDRPVGSWAGLLCRGDRAHVDFTLMLKSDHRMIFFANYPENRFSEEGRNSFTTKKPLPQNKWVMVGATWDAKSLSLWINGERDAVYPFSEPPLRRDFPEFVSVGADPGGSVEYFNGSISGAAIFNRALTELEVKSLVLISGVGSK
ncbi:MAG TPA: protein kinase [Planctomycetota bacterium]|nr:protein kinase [Planctomycetota bacterium]